jgi:tetratricopeptide (TPR) repeat protein
MRPATAVSVQGRAQSGGAVGSNEEQLAEAETWAEQGALEVARRLAEQVAVAARSDGQVDRAADALRLCGVCAARAGAWDQALADLAAAADCAVDPLLAAEIAVTRGSVLGAAGRFPEAIALLRGQIEALASIPDGAALARDARAELTAFLNLTSPKNAATWAAIAAARTPSD